MLVSIRSVGGIVLSDSGGSLLLKINEGELNIRFHRETLPEHPTPPPPLLYTQRLKFKYLQQGMTLRGSVKLGASASHTCPWQQAETLKQRCSTDDRG